MNDVIRTLDEGAAFLHELYLAYIRAGFREDQALKIVISTINEQLNQAQGANRDAST